MIFMPENSPKIDLTTAKLPNYLVQKYREAKSPLKKAAYGASMISWANPIYLLAVFGEVVIRSHSSAIKETKRRFTEEQ